MHPRSHARTQLRRAPVVEPRRIVASPQGSPAEKIQAVPRHAPGVTDYTFVFVGLALCFIVILILVTRMVTIIRPGQLGIIYFFGRYATAVKPGFNIVSPVARVRRFAVGSGINASLGLLGTAEADLGPDRPLGRVRIGDRVVAARSVSAVRAGDEVRVIDDIGAGVVLVGREPARSGVTLV